MKARTSPANGKSEAQGPKGQHALPGGPEARLGQVGNCAGGGGGRWRGLTTFFAQVTGPRQCCLLKMPGSSWPTDISPFKCSLTGHSLEKSKLSGASIKKPFSVTTSTFYYSIFTKNSIYPLSQGNTFAKFCSPRPTSDQTGSGGRHTGTFCICDNSSSASFQRTRPVGFSRPFSPHILAARKFSSEATSPGKGQSWQ